MFCSRPPSQRAGREQRNAADAEDTTAHVVLAPIGYRAPATVPLRLQANAEPFERAHTPTRRALLTGAAAALLTSTPALAKIESINPANNYYFPMAKYRYLPRIFRSWIAIDELAPQAIKDQDWEALQEVWVRADDCHFFGNASH